MLALAREAAGLTQKDLATTSGVSQSQISKAENGLAALSEEDADALAEATGVSPHLLSWNDQVHGLGTASFFHRKQHSLSQKALRKIQGQVTLLAMRSQRLAHGLTFESPLSLPHFDLDSGITPAEAAQRLRAHWRCPMGPLQGLIDHAEAAGAIVARRDFDTHRIDAISIWDPGESPLIVLNWSLSPSRQRFVVAHEIGHLVLHEGVPPRDDAEKEADAFAEELLLPRSELQRELVGLDVKRAFELKPYWQVPAQSIILRAEHLGVITQRRSRSLHAYMNKLGYLRRGQEPLEFAREEPAIVNEMVRIHKEEHRYSVQDMVSILGLASPRQLGEFEGDSRDGLRIVH
ncbi:XRE family transcriptional regulator [Phycicoccus flavus]|uniref:ImmA/IrrE family metallo-endopeptidase n=1 Tax=Phycicoccus flavus TaxID=2502783 RepID=A0A8T6R2U2_9MICO|nr:XRE family transcriptional regulator [Phycicoccus flavus]NHA68769.1 ImmA/IrrE family metallo-endopeptidase [Phycicoccus flavus]